MLLGVDSKISKTIPPESDPEYVKKGFSEVLFDEEYTIQQDPWLAAEMDTRWMPLCWEATAYFDVSICNVVAGSTAGAFCFVGVEGEALSDDQNFLTFVGCADMPLPQDRSPIFATAPITCSLTECCPPPNA
jgi:hypothetical protein